jgi:hypothetical protein
MNRLSSDHQTSATLSLPRASMADVHCMGRSGRRRFASKVWSAGGEATFCRRMAIASAAFDGVAAAAQFRSGSA